MQLREFNDRYAFTVSKTASSTDDLNLDTLRVPPGALLCVTHVCAADETTASKLVTLALISNGRSYPFNEANTGSTKASINTSADLVLGPGDFVRATIASPTSSDVCRLSVFGYFLCPPVK